MKSSHKCPKCSSTEIVLLSGSSMYTSVYGRNSLVERYACTNCGFVEEYLVDARELAELKKKYRKS